MKYTAKEYRLAARRLDRLAALLESKPVRLIEMGDFCTEKKCGTAYCVAGWAATIHPHLEITPLGGVRHKISPSEWSNGFDAFAKAYCLSYQETEQVCSGGLSNSPKARAASIRALAETQRARARMALAADQAENALLKATAEYREKGL